MLPARPVLAVFVCFACGASAVARTTREWEVDRAMQRSGLGEREILAIRTLVRESCVGAAPRVDTFGSDALLELGGLVGRDVDLAALADRIQVLRRR